jgi:hypothetical protein
MVVYESGGFAPRKYHDQALEYEKGMDTMDV